MAGSPGLLPSRVWPNYGAPFGFSRFGALYSPWWSTLGFGYSSYELASVWAYSGYGATYPFDAFDEAGSLRLQVEPKDALVYVDGYFAGVIDDFDGHFQHLDVTPGPHHVEIRAPGYDPLVFEVDIQSHHKTTYRGRLQQSAP